MTPGHRDAGEEPELHGYEQLIERARAALPQMSSEELFRIRALLEAALATDAAAGEEREALRAAARALATDL